MAQTHLLECWRTWNAYHRKVKIEYPEDFFDGHEVRKLHFLIKRCWKQIGTLHPNNHGNLKRQFRHAARNVEGLTEELSVAERTMNHTIHNNSYNGHADLPEVHEAFYRVQLDLFRAIQDLVRIERAIGAPANYIKQYDKHRAALLRPPIEAFPRRLAGVRRRFEGYQPVDSHIDPPNREPSRSAYQKLRQPDRNIDHHPGGSMYYHHLYTSHQTTAAVWVRTDDHNIIVERVVAKDCWFVEEIPYWADPKMWSGDSDDPTTKVPMEALIQEGLRHDSVLRLRGWHMHPHKLMCRHWIDGGRLNADLIPEPAIWHIFETLIKAGLVMERGDEVPQSPPWFIGGPVVHLDLKPGNVFIADYPAQTTANGQPDFAIYPRFKLADFGFSVDNRRFPRADDEYRGRGMTGYLSPEQLQAHQHAGQSQDPLNTKTNVYGIGITLMAMMNLNYHTGALNFAEAEWNEKHLNLVPQFKLRALMTYSKTLTDMVRSCVQFRQANRPTSGTLLTSLRNATDHQPGVLPEDFALGARRAASANFPGIQLLKHLGGADDYAVGMSIPPGIPASI